MRSWRRSARAGLAAGVAGLALVGTTSGSFTSQAGSAANRVTAAPDFRAPLASAAVGAKSAPYLAGKVKQGGSYRIYANATDSGNPASGISAITADVSAITTGQTAVALSAGSFSAQGTSYGFRSAALTANATLAEGAKAFTLALTDAAANARVQSGFSLTVDNTAPTAADVQAPNSGTTSRAEAGDTIVYTFSEPVDPDTILSGWTGAATNVVVHIRDNALLFIGLGNDNLVVNNAADSAQLPLGAVDLGRVDYAGSLFGGDAHFGATGTKSSMTLSGSTLTVTLGTASGSVLTAGGTGTMTWAPSATPTDAAANAMSTAAAGETGTLDRDF